MGGTAVNQGASVNCKLIRKNKGVFVIHCVPLWPGDSNRINHMAHTWPRQQVIIGDDGENVTVV